MTSTVLENLNLGPGQHSPTLCGPGTLAEIIAPDRRASELTDRHVSGFVFPDFSKIQKKRRPLQRLFKGSRPRLVSRACSMACRRARWQCWWQVCCRVQVSRCVGSGVCGLAGAGTGLDVSRRPGAGHAV